jgi:DNA-binding winged helix-turn-helix (wHTH) protein
MLVFFADFKFDRRAKVLSRGGQPLMLTAQSLELLDILLETPGELISRDMIRQRLWPDSNVEFEHSLDVLVSRLRTTLGDKSKNPRFIQTIPRKGYRFIGQVSSELNLRRTGTVRLIRKLALYAAITVVAVMTGVVLAHTRYPTPRIAPRTTLSPP